ncbi:MAG: sugar ABC transporter ATP-binding protein [Armatimonadota bacterium]|nr:sugar ABC transporter ATP-binding protein [Armatimonadota bacterium]MDR7451537.1 sugar ABC transporter ATP-binding protein [Armatimonadota bacterium]MDR7467504.1 sugar ABC transporter ATP-binding protein [Armatimonadota bacterium]MDR7494378.1 sugar ABC transporter ATP-binding protein [Armatimonadota bacterium]MDR7499195.1 sugar ABC transporter ATP-binding protein [Armatimonadota bacterium]
MPPTVILRLEGIDKRFPGVHALDHVDLDLAEGEIHMLLGENGAGKSTLLKILSGSIQRDEGRILLWDRPVQIADVQQARALGIGMVYQELSLVGGLTVAENIFLGRWPCRLRHLVDWAEIYRQARVVLDSLEVPIDPRARVRDLSVAEQQLTEIARVLASEVRILLLDEPTSALSDRERDRLFAILRGLREKGVSILYTSHRLGEIQQIGDRVTVLRDGRKVGTLAAGEANEEAIVRMMVGREIHERFPKVSVPIGAPVLTVQGLSVDGFLQDITFTVHAGEILGIFGLRGAGRTTLARALFGLVPIRRGEVFIDGERVCLSSPEEAIARGIGYTTEDRREGLLPMLSLPPNITLASLDAVTRGGVLDHRREARIAGQLVADLRIQPPVLSRLVMYLSGGNQQKVALAKWLASRAHVLIFDEPTRGIDVGAKTEVFHLMGRLAAQGAGIIMLSSEIPEVLAMADRILVMHRGRIVGEYRRGEATQEALLRSAVGLDRSDAEVA